MLALLAAGAGVGAWFGFTGQAEALRQAGIAEDNAAEADRRRIDAQSATARALTEKARLALEAGATEQALALIAEALPVPGETPPRPLVPEAAAAARDLVAGDIVTGLIDLGSDGAGTVVITPDGRQAFVGVGERLLRLDLSRAAIDAEIPLDEATGPIALLPGGDRLLTGGPTAPLTLRNLDGRVVTRFEGMEAISTAAFAPGGQVVAGDFKGRLAVWPAAGGAPSLTLEAEGDYIARLALVRPDRGFAATGKGMIIAFDPAAGRELWRQPVLEADELRLVASRDGAHVALAGAFAGLVVVNGDDGRIIARRPEAAADGGMLFRDVGGRLTAFGRDASFWAPDRGFELASTLPMGIPDTSDIAFDEASGVLLALSHERGVEVWSLDLERRLARADLGGTMGTWDRIAMAGRRAVAIGRDGRLAVLDLSGFMPAAVIDRSTAVSFGRRGRICPQRRRDRRRQGDLYAVQFRRPASGRRGRRPSRPGAAGGGRRSLFHHGQSGRQPIGGARPDRSSDRPDRQGGRLLRHPRPGLWPEPGIAGPGAQPRWPFPDGPVAGWRGADRYRAPAGRCRSRASPGPRPGRGLFRRWAIAGDCPGQRHPGAV